MRGNVEDIQLAREDKIQYRPMSYGLFAVISVILCILAMIFTQVTTTNLSKNVRNPDNVEIDTGWNITYNSTEYRNITLSEYKLPVTKKGDTITMVGRLPKRYMQNAAFIMHIRYTDFSATIDGREIYSYGRKRYMDGKLLGSGILRFNLPGGYEGKSIKIVMRVGEDEAFSSIGAPIVVDQNNWYREYAADNMWTLMISFFLILFGIVMMVCGTLSAISRTIVQSSIAKLVWMALFSISAGFWILCTSELTELFTSDLVFKVYLEYTCIYTVPFFFLCYHTDGNDNNKRALRRYLFRAVAIINIIFTFTVFLLQILGVKNLPSSLRVGQVIDVLTLTYVLATRLLDVKRKITRNYYSLIGTFVVTFYAFGELIVYNYAKYVDGSGDAKYTLKGFEIAVLIFASSLFLDYINDTIRSERNRAKIDMMAHLAYTDALTGINNRQATEDYFDKIDEENSCYCVIEFDLNELKMVNDKQGHSEGDNYIRSFADVLINASKGWGFIGRTGGDEFIAIIVADQYAIKEETEKFLQTYARELNMENSKKHLIHMSAAHGICYYNENGVHSIRQALKIADQRMYENKAEMEKGR